MTYTTEELQAMLDAATEGPWTVCPGDANATPGIDGATNTVVWWSQRGDDEGICKDADAALIAAAPDLARRVIELEKWADIAAPVKVKPLVWEDHGTGFRAETEVGTYLAHPTTNPRNQKHVAHRICNRGKSWTIGYFDGPEAAKAAAQADYEARILAALEAENDVTDLRKRAEWQPIETAPTDGMFVVVGVTSGNGFTGGRPYTTDPYCVWKQTDGEFARWPHEWPPTHWMPLPAAPGE